MAIHTSNVYLINYCSDMNTHSLHSYTQVNQIAYIEKYILNFNKISFAYVLDKKILL